MFHHRKLPDYATLLSGPTPPDGVGFQSAHLQIWYNNTDASWVGAGERPHQHLHSDQCFIVLRGSLVVEADGRLLRHALPEELLQAVTGKVWGWLIPSNELTAVRQRHLIANTTRSAAGVLARVVGDHPPHPDATPLPVTLEDAYLYFVARNGQKPEVVA